MCWQFGKSHSCRGRDDLKSVPIGRWICRDDTPTMGSICALRFELDGRADRLIWASRAQLGGGMSQMRRHRDGMASKPQAKIVVSL